MIKKTFVFIGLLFFSLHCIANTFHRPRWWFSLQVFSKLPQSQLYISFLQDNRFVNVDQSYDQSLNRVTLGYMFSNRLRFGMGYSIFIPYSPLQRNFLFEHRLHQELLWTAYESKRLNFSLRFFMEQRKFVNFAKWSWRYRQAFFLSFPKLIGGKYSLIFSEELFFTLTHPAWAPRESFDQNRAFIGIGFPATKSGMLVIGYLNQLFFRVINLDNHVAVIALRFQFV